LEDLLRGEILDNPYLVFARDHPVVMSFPSEFIWTGAKQGLDSFKKELIEGLPRTSLGIGREEGLGIAETLASLASKSGNTMLFWDEVVNTKYEQLPLTRILIEWSVTSAIRCRAKAMSGFVPIIDGKIPSSVSSAHKINLAYADVLNDRTESNIPMCFYTLDINPSMFKPDEVEPLQKMVANANAALNSQMYDGVHVHIRGLQGISKTQGRINSVKWFIDRLSDVCNNQKLPLWWSNANVIGLSGLDHGVSMASMRINASTSDELFFGGSSNYDEDNKFGKVLNVVMKDCWGIGQVKKAIAGEKGLPEFDTFAVDYDGIDTKKDRQYRLGFSKPYNMAAISFLDEDWKNQINQGEVRPGESYLKDFTPYGGWGA
jgi:hypothetical protein